MNESTPINSPMGRLAAGISVGSVLGFFVQIIFSWDGPPPAGIKFPWQGTSLGAVLVGTIAFIAGAWEIPKWSKRPTIGFLAGVVSGVIGGAFVFAPIMTSIDAGTAFDEKVLAAYKQIGIAAGSVVGGAIGLVVGIVVDLKEKRSRSTTVSHKTEVTS